MSRRSLSRGNRCTRGTRCISASLHPQLMHLPLHPLRLPVHALHLFAGCIPAASRPRPLLPRTPFTPTCGAGVGEGQGGQGSCGRRHGA